MNSFRRCFIAVFLSFFLCSSAMAQEGGNYFYYVLPPTESISINDQLISNDSKEQGKMIFKKEAQETVKVSKESSGVKFISKQYQADIKSESRITVGTHLKLESGSLHIRSLSSTAPSLITIGNLNITFQS